MKLKNRIREKVSYSLNTRIPLNGWRSTVDALDRIGAFTRKQQLEIMLIICEAIEELQESVEALYESSDS